MNDPKEDLESSPKLTTKIQMAKAENLEQLEESKVSIENQNIEALPSKELLPRSYDQTRVLLFTGLPSGCTEIDLLFPLTKYGRMLDMYILENKPCCYIEFETQEQANKVFEDFTLNPLFLGSKRLIVLYTGRQKIIKKNESDQTPSRYLRIEFYVHVEGIDEEYIRIMLQPYEILNVIFRIEGRFIAHVEVADIYSAICICEGYRNHTELRMSYINQKIFSEGGFKIQLIQQTRPSITSLQDDISPMFTGNISPGGPTWGSMPYTNMYQLIPNTVNLTMQAWDPSRWGYRPATNKGIQYLAPPNDATIIKSTVDNFGYPFQRHPQHSMTTGPTLQTPMNIMSPIKISSYNELSCAAVVVEQLPVGTNSEFANYNVTPKVLFRLFGCYGNVQRVKIHFTNKEKAFIEFQSEAQAKLAKENLNNCPLWGRNIVVSLPKKPIIIDTSRLKGKEEDEFLGDYTHSREHRYKKEGSKNTKNIAPPSNKLHLSNLNPEKDEEFYRNIFKEYCKIQKYSSIDNTMAIMEVSDIQEAVTIIILFHNYDVDGKFLKISFAKYSKKREATDNEQQFEST